MKKIVIYTQRGITKKQQKWAEDAAKEFISMFPEYKDSFRVEMRDDDHTQGKDISQRDYDNLRSADKDEYILAPNGGWLVPYKSMAWYVAKAAQGPGITDANKMLEKQNKYLEDQNSNDVFISVVKNKFKVPNGLDLIYGLSNANSVTISAASCASAIQCSEEELFKTILIHELGHVFNATPEKRRNTVFQKKKGRHCKNDLCIMGPDDYELLTSERLRRKQIGNPPGQPPFCDDCIASMREYMSRMPELTRRVQAQQVPQQTPQQPSPPVIVSKPYSMPVAQRKNPSNMPPLEEWRECLQPEPHNSREWKNGLREFYKNVATRDGDTYKENIRSQNYMARIKRADGSTLEIEANNEYNIALGRTKTTNGDTTPTIQDMRDLVRYARQKHSGMNFSKDNTPEFNARLLIACLEAGFETYKMKNKPQVTPEFLAKIKPETRRLLQNTLNNFGQQHATRQGGRS